MKPLKIDELKALKVGDWVWIVCDDVGVYARKVSVTSTDDDYDKEMFWYRGIKDFNFYYVNYGKDWFAYKNKEQAEAKGEIVELPIDRHTEVFFVDTSDGELNAKIVTGYFVDYYAFGKYGVDIVVFYNPYTDGKYEQALCHFGIWWFTSKTDAERRLAELKGDAQ